MSSYSGAGRPDQQQARIDWPHTLTTASNTSIAATPSQNEMTAVTGAATTSTSTATTITTTTTSTILPSSSVSSSSSSLSLSLLDDVSADFVTARLVVDCHCILGEGVIYDDFRHAVMWTDIVGRKLHVLQLPSHRDRNNNNNNISDDAQAVAIVTTYHLPKMLCSFGLLSMTSAFTITSSTDPSLSLSSSLPLLCAWEDGFQLYDVAAQMALSDLSCGDDVKCGLNSTRLNDGRVDPTGHRFVCGAYYGELPDQYVKVYSCSIVQGDDDDDNNSNNSDYLYQLTHKPIVDQIQVSNSICWSLDGQTMYLADSPTRDICAYEYNLETGDVIHPPRILHTVERYGGSMAVPDGSCVDTDGYLWNAVWRGRQAAGMVQRIHPITGQVTFTVHMPPDHRTSQVTCCCFGGANYDILFITTAAENTNAEQEPHAGGLYAVQLPFHGRPETRFQIPAMSALI